MIKARSKASAKPASATTQWQGGGRHVRAAFLLARITIKRLMGEEGSNLIETALVLPVYFMLVFSLMSYAIVLFAYCNATFASKAAVRYAAVHSSTSVTPCTSTDIQNIVTPFLWGAPAGGVTINSVWTPSNTISGVVSVTVTLTYTTGMPYVGLQNLAVTSNAQGVIVH